MKSLLAILVTIAIAQTVNASQTETEQANRQLQTAAATLDEKLAGDHVGLTQAGVKCRIIHSSMQDPDPSKIESSRTQLVELDQQDNIIRMADVELYYDGTSANLTADNQPNAVTLE